MIQIKFYISTLLSKSAHLAMLPTSSSASNIGQSESARLFMWLLMKVVRSLFSSKFIKASKAMSTPESTKLILLCRAWGISVAWGALGRLKGPSPAYLLTSGNVTDDYKQGRMYCKALCMKEKCCFALLISNSLSTCKPMTSQFFCIQR